MMLPVNNSFLCGYAGTYKEAFPLLGYEEKLNAREYYDRLIKDLGLLIESKITGDQLLEKVRVMHLIINSPGFEVFKAALTGDARTATIIHMYENDIRSLWGVTPIVNMISGSAADNLLGIQSKTLTYTQYHITESFDFNLSDQFQWMVSNKPDLLSAYSWLIFTWALLKFDIFHFFNDRGLLYPYGGYGHDRYGINTDEMSILKASGKRFYTLAYGADYRIKNKTLNSAKYNFCMHCPKPGSLCICDDTAGERVLKTIGQYATSMLAAGLSLDYVPNNYDMHYLVVDTNKIVPKVGKKRKSKTLRILHCPNHKYFKGTDYLITAVDKLKKENKKITLKLISNVSNEVILEAMEWADIVVDQLIGGSYGLTAIESMAKGKPVITYVRDVTRVIDMDNFPVINSNPDILHKTLSDIISNMEILDELGKKSREYVESYHSIEALAQRLQQLSREKTRSGSCKSVFKIKYS